MAHVVLSDLVKHFPATGNGDDGAFTLGPVDLEMPEGELTVLAGPSGCGKTTLLRLIAGLEKRDGGSVSIGGREVDGLPPHRRNVAMVFQDYALYPHMTVRANLAFPLKSRKRPKVEVESRVRETAERLEIEGLLDRRPDQLSGGQRQRVALGRAIVRQPDVSLLDEPLAHLDVQLRTEMRNLLVGLQRRMGLTMVHVTHDHAEAAAMADKLVVLNRGRVEQVGTPDELYERPSSRFVAGFFGSPPMNFLRGRLRREGGTCRFVSDGGICVPMTEVAGRRRSELPEGEVSLGIRPHDLLLSDTLEGDDTASTGRVTGIEQFDGRCLVRVACGADTLVARCGATAGVGPGDAVRVSIPSDRVYLFEESHGGAVLHGPGLS